MTTTKKRKAPAKKAKGPPAVSGVHARAREDKCPESGGQKADATQPEGEKNVGGRPSKFTPEVAAAIFELAKLGYTDKETAAALKIAESTLNEWKQQRPDFFASLKEAKAIADSEVERSLFERAVGYRHAAVKINQFEGVPVITPYVEHYPPDVEAVKFWLKNRKPDKWRDKVEMDVNTDFAQKLIRARERALARRKAGPGPGRRAA